jgi:hypothetical protein
MPEWIGKTREEVKAAYAKLPVKTEEHLLTFRDTDPIPMQSQCLVLGSCWPYMYGPRIVCTYVFKFEEDRVVKATREGNCRDDKKKTTSERSK